MSVFDVIAYGLLVCYYGILALICWGIWRLIRKRRWAGSVFLSVVLTVVVVFPGLSWGILPGSSFYQDLVQTRQLTGHAFFLGSAEQSHHSERAFNGDGYSIAVYSISESAAATLAAPPPEFFEKLPVRPGYRSHWEAVPWRETPSRSEDSEYINFVSVASENRGSDPNNPQDVAARLLSEEGNYYSYFYNVPSNHLGNVDLFIISPEERLLVIVNQNT